MYFNKNFTMFGRVGLIQEMFSLFQIKIYSFLHDI